MKTILITAIGGDIAQGVATAIRSEQMDYRLVGSDIHTQHGGSLYVEECFHVPPANDASYEDAILKLVLEQNIDIVIPVSEAELAVWITSDKLSQCSAQIVTAGKDVIEVGLDKLKTNEALQGMGVTVPWTVAVKESSPCGLPCIMKNRLGSGSKDIFTLYSQEDVKFYREKSSNAIFQELLLPADQEVTVAVYRTQQGKVGVFQMLRKLSGGLTSWVKIIKSEAVELMCKRIAEALDLQGSMNIQLRITQDGPRVFEINPRFSSTTVIRHQFGFKDVCWSLDELEGKMVEFPSDDMIGKHAVRTFDAVILD